MSWNGSGPANRIPEQPKAKARKPSPVRGLVAGACVVILAAVAYFAFFTGSESPKKTERVKRPDRTKEVKPAAAPKAELKAVAPTSAVVKAEKPKLPVGNVVTAKSSRVGRVMTLADGTVVTNKPKVFFKRDFEKALMVAMRPGGMAGGLLNVIRRKYTDEQILSMLKEMTIPDENDDDEIRRVKNGVQATKESILLAIRDGATVSEVLDDLRRKAVFQSKLKADSMRIRAEAVRSGDAQTVRDSVEAANAVLEKNGLRRMSVPPQFQSRDPKPETDSNTEQQ